LPQTSGTHIQESRRFESMYTLQGKTQSTRHTISTLDSRMAPDHTSTVVSVGNLSLVSTRLKHAPIPGRSLGNQRQTDLTIALGHLILPPSRQPWSRGERFWPSGYTTILAYWAHITSMRSVHSILAHGGQPIGLNRHRWGQQP
jgi:hypothetical protein